VIRGRLVRPQAQKIPGTYAIVGKPFGLPLRQLVQVGKKQHLELHRRMVRNGAVFCPTLIAVGQPFGQLLPIDEVFEPPQEVILGHC